MLASVLFQRLNISICMVLVLSSAAPVCSNVPSPPLLRGFISASNLENIPGFLHQKPYLETLDGSRKRC